ncbi:hypothetical protein [Leptolyngbya sp. CCY15150]|nr:hypothetical protein [Leptolyngbya sp. CCY15150]
MLQGSIQSPAPNLPAPAPILTLQPGMVCLVYPDGQIVVSVNTEPEHTPE